MVQANAQKKRVWQDIKLVKTQKKAVSEKVTEGQLIKFAIKLLFKKAKNRLSTIKIRYIILFLISIIIIAALAIYFFIFYFPTIRKSDISKSTDTNNPVLVKGSPTYSTITPIDKKISDIGGWTRISPPSSDPVYAFSDKIDKVPIIISQQPLPKEFKDDTEKKIDELSRNFNASQKITVGTRTIHIGTSSDGPQSVIFTENGILILIKSDSVIKNDQWIEYINSLK